MTHTARPAQTRVARQCYLLLRAELGRRLATTGRWKGLPGLLDELDALRRLHDGAQRPARPGRMN